MKRFLLPPLMAALAWMAAWALTPAPTNTHADTPTPSPIAVTLGVVTTPTPVPIPTPEPTPTPTPLPELPDYDYPAEDARCLSRAIWSITPAHPSEKTRIAVCEVIQNRVDDDTGAYRGTIREVLLQGDEFMDFDPDAHRSDHNNAVAAHVMRTWMHAQLTGDRSYRLTPPDGLLIGQFYRLDGVDYVQILNRDREVVYDSGEGIA